MVFASKFLACTIYMKADKGLSEFTIFILFMRFLVFDPGYLLGGSKYHRSKDHMDRYKYVITWGAKEACIGKSFQYTLTRKCFLTWFLVRQFSALLRC